jgi:hypothetical protein
MNLTQGTIAWVTITPQRGISKRRPVVIYTPTELIAVREKVGVIGISGSYYPTAIVSRYLGVTTGGFRRD